MEYPQQRRGVPLTARLLPIAIGLVGVAVFMMSSCVDGPFGRKQLRPINEQQEKQLGLEAFNQVLAENLQKRKLVGDQDPLVKKVREITTRLINVADDDDVLALLKLPPNNFEWMVEVIDEPQANAFCLPGGKMVIYTGIIPIAQTDAALAAVIGHEISHALMHHGAERIGQDKVKNLFMGSVAMGLGDMDPVQRQQVLSMIGMAANVGGVLPFERSHESEADRLGLVLMAKAGYDPEEAVRFWERMKSVGGAGKTPEFLSTHPDHGTRINQLIELQAEAAPFYARSQKQPTRPLPGVGGGRGFGFK